MASYIIEKLHLGKDTEIELPWKNSLDQIFYLSGLYKTVEVVDRDEVEKELRKTNFFKDGDDCKLTCYSFRRSKIPEGPIWKDTIDFIKFNENEWNKIVNKFHFYNGKRVLPLIIYQHKGKHVDYLMSIGGGGNILYVDINPDFAPAFKLYFIKDEED